MAAVQPLLTMMMRRDSDEESSGSATSGSMLYFKIGIMVAAIAFSTLAFLPMFMPIGNPQRRKVVAQHFSSFAGGVFLAIGVCVCVCRLEPRRITGPVSLSYSEQHHLRKQTPSNIPVNSRPYVYSLHVAGLFLLIAWCRTACTPWHQLGRVITSRCLAFPIFRVNAPVPAWFLARHSNERLQR